MLTGKANGVGAACAAAGGLLVLMLLVEDRCDILFSAVEQWEYSIRCLSSNLHGGGIET